MKSLILTTLLLLTVGVTGQDREFKSFFMNGKKMMATGQYQQALDELKEAYRREPKAQRFRMDGAFFESYLPRYQIALCYEQLDIMQADEWVERSKEALESEILKKKDDLAEYHKNLERITNNAAAGRANLRNAYDLKLSNAQSLLNENKFAEAKGAFEALLAMDGSRSEAKVGLANITGKRANYLDQLDLEANRGIMQKDWRKAEIAMAKIKQLAPNLATLAGLQRALLEGRESERLASLPKKEPATTVTVAETPTKTATQVPTPDPALAARRNNARAAEAQRQALRETLLESVAEYRRGYPAEALKLLQDIDESEASKFATYHWLKTVYLLSSFTYGGDQDESLKQAATESLKRVVQLTPDFIPDGRLYPDFILNFCEAAK